MKAGTWILILFVLLALVAAWYYFIYLPSQKAKGTGGSTGAGEGTSTPPMAIGEEDTGLETGLEPDSVKVLYADITEAPIPTANFSSFLKNTVAPITPRNIHYVTAFSATSTCKTNIWYKGVYYSRVSSKVDDQGYMYCYFKIADAALPAEIDVQTGPTPDCKFHVFLSTLEYKFSTVKSVTTNILAGHKSYCVYKK